jgi:membrane protein YqaA with SNARE-associated domain
VVTLGVGLTKESNMEIKVKRNWFFKLLGYPSDTCEFILTTLFALILVSFISSYVIGAHEIFTLGRLPFRKEETLCMILFVAITGGLISFGILFILGYCIQKCASERFVGRLFEQIKNKTCAKIKYE